MNGCVVTFKNVDKTWFPLIFSRVCININARSLNFVHMKRAALFDLDGVIVDSEGLYTIFWNSIEQIYPTGIPDFAHAIKGTTIGKILSNYPSDQIRDDILDRLHRYEREEMAYTVYPGVLDFVRGLRDCGISTAIVTSSDDVKMGYLFKQLPQLRYMFDIVITGTMVSRSKPDPEGYLLAASRLGCDPADCWVFEDSLQGLEAGRRAGARVVALATTNPHSRIAPLPTSFSTHGSA